MNTRSPAASGSDRRPEEARRLLEEAGVEATVAVAGTKREIAAVRAAMHERSKVAAVAPAIRALGFRYVALELRPHNEEYEEE